MADFPKRQRKLSLRVLTDLHQNGSVLFHHPYKIFYRIYPSPAGVHSEPKIVISIPKRNIKRAVDRNRIRRQIREAFRLKSSVLNKELSTSNVSIDLLCLYLPNEHIATSVFFSKMESLLAHLARLVTQNNLVSVDGND